MSIATLKTTPEPPDALFGRSMVEAFRHDIALRLLLQRIVADLLRGIQRFLEITRIKDAFWSVYLPQIPARQSPLQLRPNGHFVCLDLVHSPARFIDLAKDAKLVLNVVADLVGNNISLGKVAAGAEAVAQFSEKRGIETDNLVIIRAIEWPGGR